MALMATATAKNFSRRLAIRRLGVTSEEYVQPSSAWLAKVSVIKDWPT
jgi:hypothetical protein